MLSLTARPAEDVVERFEQVSLQDLSSLRMNSVVDSLRLQVMNTYETLQDATRREEKERKRFEDEKNEQKEEGLVGLLRCLIISRILCMLLKGDGPGCGLYIILSWPPRGILAGMNQYRFFRCTLSFTQNRSLFSPFQDSCLKWGHKARLEKRGEIMHFARERMPLNQTYS